MHALPIHIGDRHPAVYSIGTIAAQMAIPPAAITTQHVYGACVLQVLILHMQYLVIITRLNVQWPPIIQKFQSVLSTITGARLPHYCTITGARLPHYCTIQQFQSVLSTITGERVIAPSLQTTEALCRESTACVHLYFMHADKCIVRVLPSSLLPVSCYSRICPPRRRELRDILPQLPLPGDGQRCPGACTIRPINHASPCHQHMHIHGMRAEVGTPGAPRSGGLFRRSCPAL